MCTAAGVDSDINLRNFGTKGTPIDLQLYVPFRQDRYGGYANHQRSSKNKPLLYYTRTGVPSWLHPHQVLMRARFYSKWVGPYTDLGLKHLIQCGVKWPTEQQVKAVSTKQSGLINCVMVDRPLSDAVGRYKEAANGQDLPTSDQPSIRV